MLLSRVRAGDVQTLVHKLTDCVDITMVQIVRHGDHRSVWDSPPEVAGAGLAVHTHKILAGARLLREQVRGESEDLVDGLPLSFKSVAVKLGVLDEVHVLGLLDVAFTVVAEECHVGHLLKHKLLS